MDIPYEQYYLDLNAIEKLDYSKYDKVSQLYMEMLNRSYKGNHPDYAPHIATSIFNTLEKAGYLKNLRDKKLEDILN